MQIFVSHISEEAGLALVLKDWIESTFLGQLSVFVSSDPSDIPAGTKWLNRVDTALEQSGLLLSLYSRSSVERPWISFEAGCAWIRKIPIIPICHSGLAVRDLPQPLSDFQALEIQDPQFGSKLFAAIAQHGQYSKLPKLSIADFHSELLAAASKLADRHMQAQHIERNPVKGTSSFTRTQISILRELAEAKDAGLGPLDEGQLSKKAGTRPTLLEHEIQRLIHFQYVHDHLRVGGPVAYSITEQGIAYLVREQLIK